MWDINFISESNFRTHVKQTIDIYKETLHSIDLKEFNKNIVDPIKLTFDKAVYGLTWEALIGNEIFRQRDKTNNNSIGYFHQRMFQYIANCIVPDNGDLGGWDVIYTNRAGISIGTETVHKVYVEMKNKHNTMNSASAAKTYIKMQNQLLEDDDSACFLVEAIASESQNIKWQTTVNSKKVGHNRIRRVSLDQFYGLVTGDPQAFFKICMQLPAVISDVMTHENAAIRQKDTVYSELQAWASRFNIDDEDLCFTLAVYLLGFGTYTGFRH